MPRTGTAGEITNAVKDVCPILGISFIDAKKPATWTIAFADDATVEQRRAARAVLQQFDRVARVRVAGGNAQ